MKPVSVALILVLGAGVLSGIGSNAQSTDPQDEHARHTLETSARPAAGSPAAARPRPQSQDRAPARAQKRSPSRK